MLHQGWPKIYIYIYIYIRAQTLHRNRIRAPQLPSPPVPRQCLFACLAMARALALLGFLAIGVPEGEPQGGPFLEISMTGRAPNTEPNSIRKRAAKPIVQSVFDD